MALGNDIVDLKDPFAREKGRCRHYADRVLGSREISWWEKDGDPARFLWACWSVKEAAYKAFRKAAGPIPFLPRNIETTDLTGEERGKFRGTVWTPWGNACFRLFLEEDYVHALCAPSGDAVLDRARWHVEEMPPPGGKAMSREIADPSREVRKAAVRVLAPLLGIHEKSLRILRNRGNTGSPVPRLFIGERESPADLTLSHDGRYGAFAFAMD